RSAAPPGREQASDLLDSVDTRTSPSPWSLSASRALGQPQGSAAGFGTRRPPGSAPRFSPLGARRTYSVEAQDMDKWHLQRLVELPTCV
uniref:Uncharacterized protein n=1 Tax=Aegilops tauschii subsp. strangulata TaxID=200361 RepID=A0A453GVB4_AEGTS